MGRGGEEGAGRVPAQGVRHGAVGDDVLPAGREEGLPQSVAGRAGPPAPGSARGDGGHAIRTLGLRPGGVARRVPRREEEQGSITFSLFFSLPLPPSLSLTLPLTTLLHLTLAIHSLSKLRFPTPPPHRKEEPKVTLSLSLALPLPLSLSLSLSLHLSPRVALPPHREEEPKATGSSSSTREITPESHLRSPRHPSRPESNHVISPRDRPEIAPGSEFTRETHLAPAAPQRRPNGTIGAGGGKGG